MDEKLKITEFVQETHDAYRIRIATAGKPFSFKPGQFVMAGLFLKDKMGNDRVISRAYSIASSSTFTDYIELIIKEMPEGFMSLQFGKLKAGDDIYIKGPYGAFTYDEAISNNVVLLGAGSGIAPLRCITQYVADKKLSAVNVTFIYSNKKPEDIICRKELEEYDKNNKNVNVIFTITRPEGTGWKGRTGHVDAAMIKEAVKDIAGSVYYLCGPVGFVKAVSEMLLTLGVPKEKVKEEKYG